MRIFLLISVLLILNACSQPVRQPPRPTSQPPETLHHSPTALKRLAAQAHRQGDLHKLTHLLTQLWALSDKATQRQIEHTLFTAWQAADPAQRAEAWTKADDTLTPWALLSELLHLQDPAAVDKTLALYPDALFAHHLVEQLKQKPAAPDTIAVFLPLSGRFSAIGEQIRLGMLQTLFASEKPVTLLFYDSATDAATLQMRYQQAVQAGAKAIIGPVRAEAIKVISQISQLPTLLLNPSEQHAAFPYPTPSEAAQIHAHLFKQGLRHLGILHRETPRAAKLAATLQALWQANTQPDTTPYRVSTRSINNQHGQIRRQFDQLLHIQQSKARAHYLRRVLGRKLTFHPRPRQDLQTLILIADRETAAIINPLLDFYGLNLPRYGSSLLMPNHLASKKKNPDLANIHFPAFPVLLSATRITPLQAWGSDTLQLMLTPPPPKSCLNGLTGHLYRDDNLWDRHLRWLKYNASGQLIQADAP